MYKITALCGRRLGIGKEPGPDALKGCPDLDQVSSWALDGTAWCLENGLTVGGDLLRPQKTVSRGEAAILFAALARLAGRS